VRTALWLLISLLLAATARAQDVPAATVSYPVFLERDVDGENDRLSFINPLSGETASVLVTGERYTPAVDALLYYDTAAGRVMRARPDGSVEPHPFIQPGVATRRVDWLISPDNALIAWTLTEGVDDSLMTITTIANRDGTNPRQVLVDGPRSGIRALPVAFSPDHTLLYMDFQPDGISDFTPFPQYAGLFVLDIASATWDYLPDEPSCFCGAGFGNGLLLRLKVAPTLDGFDLHVYNLQAEISQVIPAQPIRNFTQAGDIVVAPDGRLAVYALAQITDFGRPSQSVRTVFMLVDLTTMTQTPLTEPITTFVEPLVWTEDNSAVIFTSRQRDGTWKVRLDSGRLDKVAEATYLGSVRG
jgi:sugar lactone lactonase YvrE